MLSNCIPFAFFLKKIFSVFFCNFLFLSLILIFVGLFFLSYSRRQRAGRILVGLGAFVILFLSIKDISNLLIKPLENEYPVYQKNYKKIDFVVVLSGGADEKYGIPMNTSGDYATLSRLIEGIRVYKLNPGSKILLTGGVTEKPFSEIEKALLEEIGIPKDDIITESRSLDTCDEAANVKKIIGDAPFVLVTSAVHMPRAVKLFQKQGLAPIPAPTDFQGTENRMFLSGMIPSSGNLSASGRAMHEYIGLLWHKLKGQTE